MGLLCASMLIVGISIMLISTYAGEVFTLRVNISYLSDVEVLPMLFRWWVVKVEN